MELSKMTRTKTLLQRELQEYRNSLLITPLVVSGVLLLLMLLSVLFANRLTIIGDNVQHLFDADHEGSGVHISINVDDEGNTEIVRDEDGTVPQPPEPVEPPLPGESVQELVVIEEPTDAEAEEWNFSQEWTFTPPRTERRRTETNEEFDSLNPVFNGVNMLFMVIMFFVSINYLLGCLYQDRKDRSILFWKSMPVSEWHEVLSKLSVASLAVPVVFLVVSVITQLFCMLLAMLLIWRVGGEATATVLANVQFIPLIINQMGGLLVWVLWTLPVYAWFILASAGARRSPGMLAFAIPLVLIFIETVFLDSTSVLTAIGNHMPRHVDGDDAASMGLYAYGPVWSSLDYIGMLIGAGFAALAVSAAVWLRRHRFEI